MRYAVLCHAFCGVVTSMMPRLEAAVTRVKERFGSR